MSERNAPCPCGSGKKYKKCCMLLSRAIKMDGVAVSSEKGLAYMMLNLAQQSLSKMKNNPDNKDKTYGVDDLQILVNLSIDLWNISYLSASRIRDVLQCIDNDVFRDQAKVIVRWAKSTNIIFKVMIIEAIAGINEIGSYNLEMNTEKSDVSEIEDKLEWIMGRVLDAVDYMDEQYGRTKETIG